MRSHRLGKRIKIKGGNAVKTEGMLNKARQDDGAEVAAAVWRQWLFAARIGSSNVFAIRQVVIQIDMVQKQNAGLGEVIGGLHDRVPQLACGQGLVHPHAIRPLVGTVGHDVCTRLRAVHQFPRRVVVQRAHEGIRHADRHVEVVPAARCALGGDEVQHIRMVDAQHTHLGATACAGTLNSGARLVKDVDVAARAGGHAVRALDVGTLGANAREVIAHTATTAHGLRGLAQGFINAGVTAIVHTLNAVTHGLHEAVDQGCLDVGARRTHDAPGANGSGVKVFKEHGLIVFAVGFFFDAGQRAGNALEHVCIAGFAWLEVFFFQHIMADGLNFAVFGVFCGTVAFHGSSLSVIHRPAAKARAQARVQHTQPRAFSTI